MATDTFADFTLEAAPLLADFAVGYRTPIAGGERRQTWQSISDLFGGGYFSSLTANRILLGQGNGTIAESDLSYSSPTLTVPDAFSLTSAGSIALTAGGSNKNVTITPSDSGAQGAVTTRAAYSEQTIIGTGGLQIVKQAVTGSVFPSLEILGYGNGFTAQPFIAMARAAGTESSPATAPISGTVGGFRYYARANSLWKNIGNVSTETSATFSDSDFSGVMRIGVSSASALANVISIFGKTGNTNIGVGNTSDHGSLLAVGVSGGAFTRTASWGVNGTNFSTQTATFADTGSSGTVATAVANSFAAPTFAASSATTFTNAANLYIAGDVAAGTNVTLTNSYGLWNAGKTRLDGYLFLNRSGVSSPIVVANADVQIGWRLTGSTDNQTTAEMHAYGTASNTFQGFQANGTPSAPTATQNGANLIRIQGGGFTGNTGTGADFVSTGQMSIMASENWSNTARGSEIAFYTATNGTTVRTERWRIVNGGALSATGAAQITGGAGNMTITAGTGNSRTMTLQTTTSGGVATTFLSGDANQNTTISQKITSYNGLATTGNGVVTIQGTGRAIGQTGAVASLATYTVGAADASFVISAQALITASTTHNFTFTCAYTDTGNTARTITLNFSNLAGTIATAIANAGGAIPYSGIPIHIRAKAATAITVATTGTFTSVTYNAEAVISKLQ